jgi:hypothetical protein
LKNKVLHDASITAFKAVEFVKEIMYRFGMPIINTTDNGTQFTARELKDFCADLGIKVNYASVSHLQGCLVPPHPILSLLADDCGSYRHLTSAAPSPLHCSIVPSLRSRDASARSSMTKGRRLGPA